MLSSSDLAVVSKERFLFFKRWLENPLRLGALAPSSKALGAKIAREVVMDNQKELSQGGFVLELGPGTGVFTEALLRAGVLPSQLLCVELDDFLTLHLKSKFPDIQVFQGSACMLQKVLPQEVQGKIVAVVSGIPMINLSRTMRAQIIDGVFSTSVPGTRLYQFTYSPFSSIAAKDFELKKRRLGTVFRNFPPATVWSYERFLAI
jgi:phosphatidylethanolamine/phosphatidyl-N-methylethanolamine N-methyltransferase